MNGGYAMHVTRPKSSKGRSRPALNAPLHAAASGGSGSGRPDRSLDDGPHLLQLPAAASPLSLNKYTVLPSIAGRRSEAGRGLDSGPSERGVLQPQAGSSGGRLGVRPQPPHPGATAGGGAAGGGSLLLAIRGPCGGRFQQHFEPSDTLLAVRAAAEARFGATYAQASIETMDVPRRSFTDMDATLGQCGIVNRSVLCISQSKDWVKPSTAAQR